MSSLQEYTFVNNQTQDAVYLLAGSAEEARTAAQQRYASLLGEGFAMKDPIDPQMMTLNLLVPVSDQVSSEQAALQAAQDVVELYAKSAYSGLEIFVEAETEPDLVERITAAPAESSDELAETADPAEEDAFEVPLNVFYTSNVEHQDVLEVSHTLEYLRTAR